MVGKIARGNKVLKFFSANRILQMETSWVGKYLVVQIVTGLYIKYSHGRKLFNKLCSNHNITYQIASVNGCIYATYSTIIMFSEESGS